MTTETKQQIIHELLKVDSESVWGVVITNFIDGNNNKSDSDYNNLMKELKEAMSDNPKVMKDILGESFDYVKEFQLPTAFSPREDEGIE
jgi:hypothetical protein